MIALPSRSLLLAALGLLSLQLSAEESKPAKPSDLMLLPLSALPEYEKTSVDTEINAVGKAQYQLLSLPLYMFGQLDRLLSLYH